MRFGVGHVMYDSAETAWEDFLPYYSPQNLLEDSDEFYEGDWREALADTVSELVSGGEVKEGDREDLYDALEAAVEDVFERDAAKWDEAQP